MKTMFSNIRTEVYQIDLFLHMFKHAYTIPVFFMHNKDIYIEVFFLSASHEIHVKNSQVNVHMNV